MEEQIKTEPSNNAMLAKLKANAPGRIIAATLPNAKSYALAVTSTQQSITVTATAQDPASRISINGSQVGNGQPSDPISLEHGVNVLEIVVTASDGKTKEHYEFKVSRAYPTPNWVRVIDHAPWVPRDSAGEIVFNDRMWLFGGYTPEVIGDVWASLDGITWEKMGDIPDPSGINIPVALAFDGKMWISTNGGRFYCSQDGKNWTKVLDQVPWIQGCGAVFKGKMWVIGGSAGRQTFSSSDGVNWKLEQAQCPWSPRANYGNVVAHAGKLWVLGGSIGYYQPFKAYRDVWCSEDGIHWTCVTDEAPWPARRWTASVVYRNRIWLLGGFRGQPTWQNFDDVWYSADGLYWKQLVTEDIWSARHELSAYVHNDRLWVIAGNSWPLVNDVWSLHIPGLAFVTQPVLEEYAGLEYWYHAEADFNQSALPIHYRLVDSPDWLRIDTNTGVVTGIPPKPGSFPITVEAYDEAGETARQSYVLRVVPL